MILSEDVGAGVTLLTIDRHERRNALDVEHLDGLHEALQRGIENGARAAVVTGAGSVFSAGADLDSAYSLTFRTSLYRTLGAITDAPIPVVAAVNGPAIGAGAQLAIACDLRVGGERAHFSVPTSRNGLAVDTWTVRRLALLTTGAVARNLLLGAGSLGPQDASRLGLLGRDGGLDDAIAWAREIAGMAPLSLAYSKRALGELFEATVHDEAALVTMFEDCWGSQDVVEARQAREEDRPPIFRGK